MSANITCDKQAITLLCEWLGNAVWLPVKAEAITSQSYCEEALEGAGIVGHGAKPTSHRSKGLHPGCPTSDQFPADAPLGKQQRVSKGPELLPLTWETRMKLPNSGFGLEQP